MCISNWIAGQVWDLKSIQVRAGHSSLKVTTDTYGHFIPQGDAHDRLEEAEARLG